MILILKHIAIEGPGTIGEFLEKSGRQARVLELQDGDALPENTQGIDGLIILGGPMNVYETDKHPFLEQEDRFIRQALEAKIPMLGICLGSQLIAKAAGAAVKPSPVVEKGWFPVQLTPQGVEDPLLGGRESAFEVFQWHEDTFDLPEGAVLLARGKDCPHQAFRLGRAYGLQFHIEVTEEIIASWIEKYFKVPDARQHPEGNAMLERYRSLRSIFDKQARQVYNNFVKMMIT